MNTIIYIGVIATLIALTVYLVVTKQYTTLRVEAFKLMLRAEKVFAAVNGKEKFDLVLTELYDRIPPILKLFVTKESLAVWLQAWYDLAKDWLDDGQVNGSTTGPT
jgi:hypothetical protein